MRATLVAFATMAAAFVWPATPASAQTSPMQEWCVSVDEAGISCNYYTLQQCQEFASGNGGFCERNPSFAAARGPAPGADLALRRSVNRQRASS
jgi:Protein of unknown function (DUF3551)